MTAFGFVGSIRFSFCFFDPEGVFCLGKAFDRPLNHSGRSSTFSVWGGLLLKPNSACLAANQGLPLDRACGTAYRPEAFASWRFAEAFAGASGIQGLPAERRVLKMTVFSMRILIRTLSLGRSENHWCFFKTRPLLRVSPALFWAQLNSLGGGFEGRFLRVHS